MLNKKGFTLIEMMMVIVILSIILAITVPSLIGYFDQSKDSSEQVFMEEMEDVVSNFISLRMLSFQTTSETISFYKCDNPCLDETDCRQSIATRVNLGREITLNDITTAGLVNAGDLINPKTEKKCNLNTPIEIYKDNDSVFCFKMSAAGSDCLSEDISSCMFNEEGNTILTNDKGDTLIIYSNGTIDRGNYCNET